MAAADEVAHVFAEAAEVSPARRLAAHRVSLAARCWLFAGVALFPLVWSGGLEDGYVLPKVALLRLLDAGLFVAWLARCAVMRGVFVRRSVADLPVLAFVASSALSAWFAENRTLALWGAYTRYESLLTHVTYAAVFWFIVQFLETREQVRGLVCALLAGGFAAGAWAVVQSARITMSPEGPGTDNAFAFDGIARAYGTMGNATLLGTLMALLIPLAIHDLLRARSVSGRVAGVSTVVVITVALVLTFSRSSWIGAVAGMTVPAITRGRPSRRRISRWGAAATAAAAGTVVVWLWWRGHAAGGLAGSLADRVSGLVDVGGSGGTRLHFWADTVGAIVQRPLVGYGPDNFGLVYPLHQSGDWTPGFAPDRAHSDVLDLIMAQGVLGVAAMAALAVALVRVCRRAGDPVTWALLAACVAYEVATMLNFAWVPVTAVAWMIAAAVVAPTARQVHVRPAAMRAAGAAALMVPATAAVVTVLVFGVVRPIVADRDYFLALDLAASDPAQAVDEIRWARSLAPYQGEYATEAGDLAFEAAAWPAAAEAYHAAVSVGSGDSGTFAGLAEADCHLGRTPDARAAWSRAAALSPYMLRGQAPPC